MLCIGNNKRMENDMREHTTIYYSLVDLDTVAKQEDDMPYIYDKETHDWEIDVTNLFADRLMGIEGENADNCHEITEEEAEELIREYDSTL